MKETKEMQELYGDLGRDWSWLCFCLTLTEPKHCGNMIVFMVSFKVLSRAPGVIELRTRSGHFDKVYESANALGKLLDIIYLLSVPIQKRLHSVQVRIPERHAMLWVSEIM